MKAMLDADIDPQAVLGACRPPAVRLASVADEAAALLSRVLAQLESGACEPTRGTTNVRAMGAVMNRLRHAQASSVAF